MGLFQNYPVSKKELRLKQTSKPKIDGAKTELYLIKLLNTLNMTILYVYWIKVSFKLVAMFTQTLGNVGLG